MDAKSPHPHPPPMGTMGRAMGTAGMWGVKASPDCLAQSSLCNSLGIQHHEHPCRFYQSLQKEYVKFGGSVTATKYEVERLSSHFQCKNSMKSYLCSTLTPTEMGSLV